jgi:hypothetical protein
MGESQIDWRLVGEEFTTCNCDWGCPCQFDRDPTHGNCRALLAYRVREGQFGDVSLDGVTFAEAVSWPAPFHEGDGTCQVYVDEGASPEQRDAIEGLMRGEHGGDYFEIFASVLPHRLETQVVRIELEMDREARRAPLRIPGFGESAAEPILNPVTGEEHRVRIDLPDGFEYKLAEIGNAVRGVVTSEPPLDFEYEESYAQLNEFDWSPA